MNYYKLPKSIYSKKRQTKQTLCRYTRICFVCLFFEYSTVYWVGRNFIIIQSYNYWGRRLKSKVFISHYCHVKAFDKVQIYSETPYKGHLTTRDTFLVPFWYLIMLNDYSTKDTSTSLPVPMVSLQEGYHCITCTFVHVHADPNTCNVHVHYYPIVLTCLRHPLCLCLLPSIACIQARANPLFIQWPLSSTIVNSFCSVSHCRNIACNKTHTDYSHTKVLIKCL